MRLLEDRIKADGVIKAGDVLKVDSFLNHQIDVAFVSELGEEFYRLYRDCGVNKILTIEASGIGIACLTARFFACPVVFAKKSKTKNISDDVYSAEAVSYTHGNTSTVICSKEFLSSKDRVLIIDDFLANGAALTALASIADQAGATVVGAGIVIEKAYQGGGDLLRSRGMRIESLAKIKSMNEKDGFTFCD
ncbi:MAG: xanthine phosphoribosyltransferase [Clostridia bacterium]|nr:xanthine phosphoribosyltransferase [Clostridia bacterium]MBQ3870548.1 xanthine phosphoribosyltransferase [Clostridia bacterium]